MHLSDPRGDPEGGKVTVWDDNVQAWNSSCYAYP